MLELEHILNKFLAANSKLSSLPEIYLKLDELLKSNKASIHEISFLISNDPALSASVLKLANSAAYGFKSQIQQLERAISLIGTNEIRNLVLINAVVSGLNAPQTANFSQEDFWRRSIYCALIAKKLARFFTKNEADRLFVCGLLSRLGQLICCQIVTDESAKILLENQSIEETYNELFIEQKNLGFCYNELSAQLLKSWSLPEEIYQPIWEYSQLHSDAYAQSKPHHKDSIILYCASIISFMLELSIDKALESKAILSLIDPHIRQYLGLNRSFINELLLDIELDAMEILGAIFPNSSVIY